MIGTADSTAPGENRMSATGLSADVDEYRRRLAEQSDDQIDSWAAELMRDMSIRSGVIPVLDEFRHATGLSDQGLERVFAAGGGARQRSAGRATGS